LFAYLLSRKAADIKVQHLFAGEYGYMDNKVYVDSKVIQVIKQLTGGAAI